MPNISFLVIFSLLIISASASASVIRLPSEAVISSEKSGDPCPISSAVKCPVSCFKPDPVCGKDGVTYWCGCADAHCAGTRVAKLGYCEVGSGSGPKMGQALLLAHIVWLIVIGFSLVCGLL